MPLQNSGSALFAGSAGEFMRMAPESSLTAHVSRQFGRIYGKPNESEVRSWRNSLTALAKVLSGTGLDDSGVGVELRLPSNNRRIDASLVAHDREGQPHAVLVELKQWQTVSRSMAPDNVLVADQERLHPSVQVSAYAEYLRSSHSAFTEHGFRLSACAYLHNMSRTAAQPIRGLEYHQVLSDTPLFTAGDEEALGKFLSRHLEGGGGMDLLPTLVSGRHSPSTKLIDGVAKALEGSPVWTLIDEQRVAYNLVRGHVDRAAKTGNKTVVVVVGGPGTGKSVIAVHLLLAMSNAGYRTAHSTASKAFTVNLRAIGGKGSESLFCWNKDFAHKVTPENSLDLLIVDEAHRVRLSSNTQYTGRAVRSEIPQANELIRAARVTVFFLDERQNVRPDEIGNVAALATAADEEGVPLVRLELDAQFRCNGSSEYIKWVDALFSSSPRQAEGWLGAEYDVAVLDSPAALEAAVREQAKNGRSSRLIAGYCWEWSDPDPAGALAADVRIGTWGRPWNEKSREQMKKAGAAPKPIDHPYTQWATQPKGLEEIGCIYSAQGFEFDFCGVIMGDDLVWRGGAGWIASKDASHDPAIARRKHTPERLMALISHSYRVLLTRGMRGTFIYSTDRETREFLHSLLTAGPMASMAV
jgi:uncharacterized protein